MSSLLALLFTVYVLHSVPSYKERSCKEQLVDFHVTKEQRLVDLKIAKERVP